MRIQDLVQIVLFLFILIALTPVLGSYMYKVFTGNKHFMLPVFGWLEKLTYKSTGVNPEEETNWKSYTFGLLMFQFDWICFCVSDSTLSVTFALESCKSYKCIVAFCFQYCSKFYDQHQLARVCRRNNTKLFRANDWTYSSELCKCCNRNSCFIGPHKRSFAENYRKAR